MAMKTLWRAFVDGVIDNDENVASLKNTNKFKTTGHKTKPCEHVASTCNTVFCCETSWQGIGDRKTTSTFEAVTIPV